LAYPARENGTRRKDDCSAAENIVWQRMMKDAWSFGLLMITGDVIVIAAFELTDT
jgi:hypothetical protein